MENEGMNLETIPEDEIAYYEIALSRFYYKSLLHRRSLWINNNSLKTSDETFGNIFYSDFLHFLDQVKFEYTIETANKIKQKKDEEKFIRQQEKQYIINLFVSKLKKQNPEYNYIFNKEKICQNIKQNISSVWTGFIELAYPPNNTNKDTYANSKNVEKILEDCSHIIDKINATTTLSNFMEKLFELAKELSNVKIDIHYISQYKYIVCCKSTESNKYCNCSCCNEFCDCTDDGTLNMANTLYYDYLLDDINLIYDVKEIENILNKYF